MNKLRSILEPWEVSHHTMFDPGEITEEVVRNKLKQHALYSAEHAVFVKEIDQKVFINWRSCTRETCKDHIMKGTRLTGFDVQIEHGIFYILNIEVEAKHRGKGFGFHLYNLLEEFARDFRCRIINMTPSGHARSATGGVGESRKDYVVRKLGYHLVKEGLSFVAIKNLD